MLEVCALADLVFLGLHGQDGEDGRVQAAFDLLGIPYTGSGYLASGMAMDKSITKTVMDQVGIPNAPWRNIPHYTEADIPRLTEELEVPCAVKVVNGGSSLGLALPGHQGGALPGPERPAPLWKPHHRGKEAPGTGADGGGAGGPVAAGGGDHPHWRRL